MTLTERVRNSIPPQPNLRRVSLRTKLVASVLILVFAALSLISLASTYALHSYLISRMDDQLRTFANTSVAAEKATRRARSHARYASGAGGRSREVRRRGRTAGRGR